MDVDIKSTSKSTSKTQRGIHVTAVLAMSADGKIADFQRSPARFSSQADIKHLEAEIANVDGVLFGGGTLRAYGASLPVHCSQLLQQRRSQGLPEQPLQIVWSPSGHFDPHLRFFQQPVPRALLTTSQGAAGWSQPYFSKIWEMPSTGGWMQALRLFEQAGLRRLALLGGGRLVAALLAEDCIDELVLTVCPLLLGGETAPTPVDGQGFLASAAPRLKLHSCRVDDQEIYLRYGVQPPLQPSENSSTLESDCL